MSQSSGVVFTVLVVLMGLHLVSDFIRINILKIRLSNFLQVFLQKADNMTAQERRDRCSYLNSVRSNFTVCCAFPLIVLWRWQMDECAVECLKLGKLDDPCCIQVCNYRKLEFIYKENDPVRNATHDPTAGLIFSFWLSVGNETKWNQPITDSCNYCFNAVTKQAEFDFCGIPNHIYQIIDCAYNEVYFRCPFWNPFNVTSCELTKQYIDLCYRIWIKLSWEVKTIIWIQRISSLQDWMTSI